MSVPVVAPRDLLVPGLAPDRLDDLADPLVVVDLDGPGAEDAAVAAAAGRSDRILVGVGTPGPLCEALDTTLVRRASDHRHVAVDDVDAAVSALCDRARTHPLAATVLARLLRWSAALPVDAALDAESLAYSTLLGGREFTAWSERRGPRPAPVDVAEPVVAARADHVLRLTLNRPERRNAYGRQLRDALVSHLDIALLDPSVERIVLDGAGASFCAGGDLDEFATTPDLATAHLIRTRAGAARPLHRLRDRTEVHLHGACVGAGIELPAFAGRVVAAPGTTMWLPELPMGLIPGAGGTVSIARRIGRWRTLWLVLSGVVVDTETALAWGLVDEIADICPPAPH
ncbi:enoyl-CoA hydratase/isomerase family protein [Pseudonocardia alni]|uniref:Enoyl-CoA hydratase/carnithine racemase n=1 Tax=Pseudonocardia alni TaxID=33907 RepID=A0A852W8J3_PSEA5|nr:enoyl-CoA hydratase/isomerase family protein [Pseudonocardia antarctica]NYG05229.1 enoyl-CoA hydratase/carnithine racemase [Pseudonocardia antarctica]